MVENVEKVRRRRGWWG